MSTEQPVGASDTMDRPSAELSAARSGGRLASGPLWGLLVALVGGGLAWAIHQACDPVFRLPERYNFDMGPPPGKVAEVTAAQNQVDLGNRVFACGLLGVMFGAALGVGEGLARRSLKTILLAAVGCGLATALFGCAAGTAGHFVYLSRAAVEERLSLASTVMVHCALWGTLGAGIGLAFGSLAGRIGTVLGCLIAGLAAGALAGAIFPAAASYVMPAAQTDWPVPIGANTRLLWIGCPAVLLGLIVPFAGRQGTTGQSK